MLDRDPAGGILAFRSMLRGLIAMPGRFMDDGKDPDLFDHFAIVAQRTNVYTVRDYASIIEHLVKAWDIAGRSVTGEAARAQDELCRQAERHLRLAERTASALAKQPRGRSVGSGTAVPEPRGTAMKKKVIVHDRMQDGYVYWRTEPVGRNFAAGFTPDLTPKEMLRLGVFGGKYITDCQRRVSPPAGSPERSCAPIGATRT